MGKKRKAIEIDEEDIIQTVLVSSPYGWKDPAVWDAEDRNRRDDGLYVFVEWLELIFGASDPGALRAHRELGPIVGQVWYWNGRDELLASIRNDIDINLQLGSHFHSEIMKRPIDGRRKRSTITKARYIAEVEIVGRGEGWKPFSKIPDMSPPSIRRHKFATPYPLPSPVGATDPVIQIFEGIEVKEEKKGDTKQGVKHETDIKPSIKTEGNVKVDPNIKSETLLQSTSSLDVNNNVTDRKHAGIVKREEHSGDLSQREKDESTQPKISVPQGNRPQDGVIKAEPESFEDMIKRARARRDVEQATVGSQGASPSLVRPVVPQNSTVKREEDLADVNGDWGMNRPVKRVKHEE